MNLPGDGHGISPVLAITAVVVQFNGVHCLTGHGLGQAHALAAGFAARALDGAAWCRPTYCLAHDPAALLLTPHRPPRPHHWMRRACPRTSAQGRSDAEDSSDKPRLRLGAVANRDPPSAYGRCARPGSPIATTSGGPGLCYACSMRVLATVASFGGEWDGRPITPSVRVRGRSPIRAKGPVPVGPQGVCRAVSSRPGTARSARWRCRRRCFSRRSCRGSRACC